MINKNFINLFNHPERQAESDDLKEFHMDIAASIQNVIEILVLKFVNHLSRL